MIDKPTHYINESSSCIDLIFSSNVNLTKNCGVEQSHYEKCHHNIIYGTLNFNIPLPPPYYRELWVFKSSNTDIFKNQLTILTGLGLFKIKITTNNAKSYWIYFVTSFPIKLKKLIIKLLNGLINQLDCL